MMTTTAEPEDYTARTVCFTAAMPHGERSLLSQRNRRMVGGMTSTRQNVTANGEAFNVNPPRNADDTFNNFVMELKRRALPTHAGMDLHMTTANARR